jgi:PhoPQ-activated pathogenicity-related protein
MVTEAGSTFRRAFLLGLAAAGLFSTSARADLEAYVKARDGAFEWNVHQTIEVPGVGSASIVRLTSQVWQGITWRHWLYLIRPEKVTRPEHALLVVSGGSTRKEPPTGLSREAMLLAGVAQKTGSLIAVLTQVPNQPLFENLKEDALIAFTFAKFLETKDETWPCLLPMTKSAVRAMDAVQAWAREKHSQEIKNFVVTGASKRGWTTWLTSAVDPRVEAIAPMVIDTLNFAKQMPHQILSFGKYSEQIEDYTRLNLPDRVGEPEAQRLNALVDPYSYLKKLTMPKLIVLGTNDRYWPVDAVKHYFPDLPGEKLLHHLPNAGHGLGPAAVEAIVAFYHSIIQGHPRPRFDWTTRSSEGLAVLTLRPQDPPLAVELWEASSDTRDFREAVWTSSELSRSEEGGYEARIRVPLEGFRAFFARLSYRSPAGDPYFLSTNVEMVGERPRAKS